MLVKEFINKSFYHNNGYLILNTNLEFNQNYKRLVKEINEDIKFKLTRDNLHKYGGYLMGNLNIDQGKYGPKFYSLIFKKDLIKILENLINDKIKSFDIFYGGNLVLPNKGKQHFHIDGVYNKKMYMISFATEDINYENGPTEICVGTHKKEMKFYEFFWSKKIKKKILLKKGQILIRPHNLWHRGTKNKSKKPRILLSFSITPKIENSRIYKSSSNLKIFSNFFKPNFVGRIREFSYVYLEGFHIILRFLKSLILKK